MRRLAFPLLMLSVMAGADTVTESFSDLDHFSASSTAVWNIAGTKAHLPYFANTNGVGTDTQINIGTGKD
jgi:hypothetical protein